MSTRACPACESVGLPPCEVPCSWVGRPKVSLERPTGRKAPRRPGMPETIRLASVSTESQKIGEFLEWLDAEGMTLAVYGNGELYPAYQPIEKLLARYYGIDLDRVDRERRRLLAYLRTRGDT